MPSLGSRVASVAFRRARRGDSRAWLSVAVAVQGARLARRLLARRPEVLRVKLRPGEAVEIREIPPAR